MDNIKVAIRVRALIAREVNAGAKVRWIIRDNTIYQDDPECKDSFFVFDSISDHRRSNLEVFNEVARPIVAGVMQGINGSVFAYGQTSSGKTYTMLGDSQEPGIIPLAIQEIFETIENTPDREFLLRVSYMEIYNEEIQDLLTGAKNLKIRETADKEVYVGDLKEQLVTDAQQIYTLMRQGEQRRHIGATNMNEHSSRSHTIFRVIVESRQRMCTGEELDLAVNVSHMNLVDLAGSERTNQTGATGDRFKEGCAINKSLFTLGYVICKLSEGENHVPFRDSKLTRILQNSLGGNSRTAIICTVTPAAIDETISTLKFASRAKNIRNQPTVNEVLSDEALLRRYRMQIQTLQKQLEQSCSTTSLDSNHPDVAALERQLAEKSRKESELRSLVEKLTQMICVSHSDSNNERTSQAASLAKKDKRRETWCPGKQAARWNLIDDVGTHFPKHRALRSHAGDDFSFVQSPEDMLNAAERCRIAEMDASDPTECLGTLLPNPSAVAGPAFAPEAFALGLAVASVSVQAEIDNPLVQELEQQVFMLREENMLLKNLMEELECDLKSHHEKEVANLQQALQAAEWQRDELEKEVLCTQREKSERLDTTAGPASPRAADAQPLDEALQVALLHSQVHDTGRLLEAKLEENARLAGQVATLIEEKACLAEDLAALQQRLGDRQNSSLWAFEALESIADNLDDREAELSDLRSKVHNRSSHGLVTFGVQTTPSNHRADFSKAAAAERMVATPRTRLNDSVILDSMAPTKREDKILIDGLLAAQTRLDGLLEEALQLNNELTEQKDMSRSEQEARIKSLEEECSQLQAELDSTTQHRDALLAQIFDDRKVTDMASAELVARAAAFENECGSLKLELEVITRDRDSLLATAQVVGRSEPVSTADAAAMVPAKIIHAIDFTLLDSSRFEMTTYMDIVHEQQSQCRIPSLYDELCSASREFPASLRRSVESLAPGQDTCLQAVESVTLSQELDHAKSLIADLERERDFLKATTLALEKQLHSPSVTPTTIACQTSPLRPEGSNSLPGGRTAQSPSATAADAAATPTPTVAIVRPQCHTISDSPMVMRLSCSTDRNSSNACPESCQQDLSLKTSILVDAFDPSTSTTLATILDESPTDVNPSMAIECNGDWTTTEDAVIMPSKEGEYVVELPEEDAPSAEPVEMQGTVSKKLAAVEAEATQLRVALNEQLRIETCYMEALADLRKDLDDMAAKLTLSEEENVRLRGPSSESASSHENHEQPGGSCQVPPCNVLLEKDCSLTTEVVSSSLSATELACQSVAFPDEQVTRSIAALGELTTKLSANEDENARLRSELDACSLETEKLNCYLNAAECRATDFAVTAENLRIDIREQHNRNSDLVEKLAVLTAQIVSAEQQLQANADESAKLQSELLCWTASAQKYKAEADSLLDQFIEMKSKLEASESIINELQCALRAEEAAKLHIKEMNEQETEHSLSLAADEQVRLRAALQEHDLEVERLRCQLSDIQAASSTRDLDHQGVISKLRNDLEDAYKTKTCLEDRLTQATDQLDEINVKLSMVHTENVQLRGELNENAVRIEMLKRDLAAAECRISDHAGLSSSELTMLEAENRRLKSHIDELNDDMEKLKSELASVDILLAESHANAEFMSMDLKEQLMHERESASGLANQIGLLTEQLAASSKRVQLAEAESADLQAITGEQQKEVSELHARIAQLEDCAAHEQTQRLQDQKRADEAFKSKEMEMATAQASYRQDLADKIAELGRKELKLQSIEREHIDQLRKVMEHHHRLSAGMTPSNPNSSTSATPATQKSYDSATAVHREEYDRAVQQVTQLRQENERLEAKLKELEQKQPVISAEQWKVLVDEKDDQIKRLQADVQHIRRCNEMANGKLDEERAQSKELKVAAAVLREQLRTLEREHEEQLHKLESSSGGASTANSSCSAGNSSTASDKNAPVARAKYDYVVQKATEYRKAKEQLAEKLRELQLKLEMPSEHWKAIVEDKDDQIERLEAEVQRVMRCCEEADNELDDEKAQHDALKAVVADLREQLSNGSSRSSEHLHGSLRKENFELQLKVEQLERDLTVQAKPLRLQIAELSKETASLRERCTFYKNEARRLLTSQHDVTVGMKTQANAATQCELNAAGVRPLGTTSQSAAGLSTWNPSLPLQPPGCGIVEELEKDRLKQEVQQLRRQLKQAHALQLPTQMPLQQPSKPVVGAVATGPVNARPVVDATEPKPSVLMPQSASSTKLPAPAKTSANVLPPRPALTGITNSPKKAVQGKAKFFPDVGNLISPQGVARGPTVSSQPQPSAADDDNITGCKQQ